MQIFSDRLRKLRNEAGENQAVTAEAVGVSMQSLSAYETGREPNYDVLLKLAKHFSCSTDYLLGKSNTRKPENALLSDSLGLGDEAIANIQLCYERGWATDDFISHTYFRPLILKYTAYKNIEDSEYLDKKLGITFDDSFSEKQRKLLLRAEIDDSVNEILEDK